MGKGFTGGVTSLLCGACKHNQQIVRLSNKVREVGHIKHMYCPVCKKEQAFMEHTVRDRATKSWMLEEQCTPRRVSALVRLYDLSSDEFLTEEAQSDIFKALFKEQLRNVSGEAKCRPLGDMLDEVTKLGKYQVHLLDK